MPKFVFKKKTSQGEPIDNSKLIQSLDTIMTKAVYDSDDDGVIAAAQLDPALATDAEVTTAVSDHAGAADPHTGYRLESADHSHQSTGAQAGKIDHGAALDGLTDDDHTQYLKEQMAEDDLILLDAVLSADEHWCGIADVGTMGYAATVGDLMYLAVAAISKVNGVAV